MWRNYSYYQKYTCKSFSGVYFTFRALHCILLGGSKRARTHKKGLKSRVTAHKTHCPYPTCSRDSLKPPKPLCVTVTVTSPLNTWREVGEGGTDWRHSIITATPCYCGKKQRMWIVLEWDEFGHIFFCVTGQDRCNFRDIWRQLLFIIYSRCWQISCEVGGVFVLVKRLWPKVKFL